MRNAVPGTDFANGFRFAARFRADRMIDRCRLDLLRAGRGGKQQKCKAVSSARDGNSDPGIARDQRIKIGAKSVE